MFVDALDVEMYNEHHSSGRCYLSLPKVIYFYFEQFCSTYNTSLSIVLFSFNYNYFANCRTNIAIHGFLSYS